MCGIAGIRLNSPAGELRARLQNMSDSIAHRGPDGSGTYFEESQRLGLAHRRLSIIDLSDAGAQPMVSASGRYVITYNGEIYNYPELRQKLERTGVVFRGHSDTEVLLAGCEAWGLAETLQQAIGMFALGLFDREAGELSLARDRLGKKPLYYGVLETGEWVFASELKAVIRGLPSLSDLDGEALGTYFRYGYISAPLTVLSGVKKVIPGSIVRIAIGDNTVTESKYWSAVDTINGAAKSSVPGSADEWQERFEELFLDAVQKRLIADVPVGAFLSGGIDSTSIVAAMVEVAEEKVASYTIGFAEQDYNEAEHAAALAKHLGTDHHEMYVSHADLLNNVPQILRAMDEPFSDVSILPTYLVSKLAVDDVKVVLSGDGGDELFGGYTHYDRIEKAARVNRSVGWMIPESIADSLCNRAGGAGRLSRMAALVGSQSDEEICRAMLSRWQKPSLLVPGASDEDGAADSIAAHIQKASIIEYAMARDLLRYLPDDILHKVDRASMAVSLEARAPLLDHRIVELAWSMPLAVKRNYGVAKIPLRRFLEKRLPAHLFERPKKGFGVPISAWLQHGLKEWAGDLLGNESNWEFLNKKRVMTLFDQHQSGQHDRGSYLWDILIFVAWLQDFKAGNHRNVGKSG